MCGYGSKEICRVENHRATDELVTCVDENGETYKKKYEKEKWMSVVVRFWKRCFGVVVESRRESSKEGNKGKKKISKKKKVFLQFEAMRSLSEPMSSRNGV